MEEPEKTQKPTTLPPDLATQPKTAPKKIAPVKKKTAEKDGTVTPPKPTPAKDEEKPRHAPKSVLETADKDRLKELQSRTGRMTSLLKTGWTSLRKTTYRMLRILKASSMNGLTPLREPSTN